MLNGFSTCIANGNKRIDLFSLLITSLIIIGLLPVLLLELMLILEQQFMRIVDLSGTCHFDYFFFF